MSQMISIPEKYEIPFRRILPYLNSQLLNNPKIIESLVLYYKLGGEKMARIVVDALNVTHRIQHAEMMRKMREEAILRESQIEQQSTEDAKEVETEGDKDGD